MNERSSWIDNFKRKAKKGAAIIGVGAAAASLAGCSPKAEAAPEAPEVTQSAEATPSPAATEAPTSTPEATQTPAEVESSKYENYLEGISYAIQQHAEAIIGQYGVADEVSIQPVSNQADGPSPVLSVEESKAALLDAVILTPDNVILDQSDEEDAQFITESMNYVVNMAETNSISIREAYRSVENAGIYADFIDFYEKEFLNPVSSGLRGYDYSPDYDKTSPFGLSWDIAKELTNNPAYPGASVSFDNSIEDRYVVTYTLPPRNSGSTPEGSITFGVHPAGITLDDGGFWIVGDSAILPL